MVLIYELPGRSLKVLMSSILKSDNVKFKYITLSKNNLPESRLLIDRQKEKIENKVKVGPYARLREGTHLMSGVKIGNFV